MIPKTPADGAGELPLGTLAGFLAGARRADLWLASRADAAALLLVAAGAAARLIAAGGTGLSVDETLHLRIAASPTLRETYRVSLFNAHPPLFVLLLHGWMRVAASAWALRLLPVAFGVAMLWAGYRWSRAAFGTAASLMTLVLLSFLPALVVVSAELRGYSAMLAFMAAALLCLELALEERSGVRLALFAAFGALSLLSHYSAAWFLLAAFSSGTIRVIRRGVTARFRLAWTASALAVAALSFFLYETHVSRLRGGALEAEARSDWLRESYFRAGSESPWGFLGRQTLSVFEFLFSTKPAAVVALALTVGGLAVLFARRRPAASLLALPFVFAAAAGLTGLCPYGGTRHCVHLAPFAAAIVGVALAELSGRRLWAFVLLAAVLAPAAFAVGL